MGTAADDSQVCSLGSSCLGVGICTCRAQGHREEIPQSISLLQLELATISPSPATPSASADPLGAEWIFYCFP